MADAFEALDRVIESATSAEARAGLVVELSARLARLGASLVVTAIPPGTNSDKNLDVEEAAAKLNVSRSWLYRNQGQLPTIRLGRRLLFPDTKLNEFLKRRRS